MPCSLRGVLHRSVHHIAHSGHAWWKAGWGSLRAAAAGRSLRAFRPAGAPGFLHEFAADG